MLNNAKIDFVTDGVYISYINGIGEFDNGKNSGWMYRVNDVISNVGYAAKKLSDGDVIEWFYTDDYTTEKKTTKKMGRPETVIIKKQQSRKRQNRRIGHKNTRE
ncbi:MAG: DUF4430 domain-containing protein [Clostridiales bacterium]|nr:MAG: DUF4430 domain-containing protein [Clostridiales bacterium]